MPSTALRPISARDRSGLPPVPAPVPLPQLELAGHFWLSTGGQRLLDGQRVDLLEAIHRIGTLTGAARAIGMSYKWAWDAIVTMNDLAGMRLVERQAGGRSGGGTRLTPYGLELVDLYRRLAINHRRQLAGLSTAIYETDPEEGP